MFINLVTKSNLVAHNSAGAQKANRMTQTTSSSTAVASTATMQDCSGKHAAAKTPSADVLARNGKVIVCAHILVSHKCLLDILSGIPYADLILKYPRRKECLENCECTNIWKLNSGAARNRIQNRGLKAFLSPGRKEAIHEPQRITARHYLLFAPITHEIDVPLGMFFTKERLSQVLCGFNVGLCRHVRHSDTLVLESYKPKDVIDRDRCGPGKSCSCARTGTNWGGFECQEDGCRARFYFSVVHMVAVKGRLLIPAEQCECLTIVTSRTFPSLETGMDPSWTGCAIAPEEFKDGSTQFRRWDIHRVKCYTRNREWYNQACVENLNRRAGINIARYCGKPGDYVAAPEMATDFVQPPEQSQAVSEAWDMLEDLPPPYSPSSNLDPS